MFSTDIFLFHFVMQKSQKKCKQNDIMYIWIKVASCVWRNIKRTVYILCISSCIDASVKIVVLLNFNPCNFARCLPLFTIFHCFIFAISFNICHCLKNLFIQAALRCLLIVIVQCGNVSRTKKKYEWKIPYAFIHQVGVNVFFFCRNSYVDADTQKTIFALISTACLFYGAFFLSYSKHLCSATSAMIFTRVEYKKCWIRFSSCAWCVVLFAPCSFCSFRAHSKFVCNERECGRVNWCEYCRHTVQRMRERERVEKKDETETVQIARKCCVFFKSKRKAAETSTAVQGKKTQRQHS